MKKSVVLLFIFSCPFLCFSNNNDSLEICGIMNAQVACWNRGDIDGFMDAYWNSDSLMFIGKDGITFGWEKTLENYKARYPDKSYTGELKFDIMVIEKLGTNSIYVVGKWSIKREPGDAGGHFTLIWKRINGKWLIVSDHTD